MKFINLMSDKIDFLFRRGKNADERMYDFFIRTVTFLILALIILCYGSFVHADNSLSVTLGIDTTKLNDASNWIFNNDDFDNFYYQYYGENPVNRPIGNSGYSWVNNLPASSEYNYTDNYVFIRVGSYSGSAWLTCTFIPKSLIENGNIIIKASNNFTYYSDGNYTLPGYTMNTGGSVYDRWNTSLSTGINTQNDGNYTYYTVFSNIPLYDGDFTQSNIDYLKNNNFVDDLNKLHNVNYFCYPDLDLCSSAFLSNGGNSDIPEVESNKNHMSFDNVQIGISSLQDGQNLDSASVIVGCSVDDWINNNIDYYSVKVTYTIGGKFRTLSPWTFDYYEVMPLKTFTNNVYVKSMHDIFVGMGYYNSNTYQGVNDSYIVDSDLSYNGGFPSLLNKTGNLIVKSIGTYRANKKDDNVQLILDDYYLNVDVVLIASDVQEPSGNFSKKFDFIRGNESIINSDGLQNSDPWTGEENPQVDPYVPDVGSSTGGNQINNNNQTVNINLDNRFQNIVSGGATDDDYDNTVDNLRELFGTFKQSLAVMGDSTLDQDNNPNGFVGLLQNSYSFIPGMPYYILGIVIIVALCVLLFIIKALVF